MKTSHSASFFALLPDSDVAPLELLPHVHQQVDGGLDARVDLLAAGRLVYPLDLHKK